MNCRGARVPTFIAVLGELRNFGVFEGWEIILSFGRSVVLGGEVKCWGVSEVEG